MASDFGRGLRFGMGFALGMGAIMLVMLFGVSMCAGQLQERMFERLQERMDELAPPPAEYHGDTTGAVYPSV